MLLNEQEIRDLYDRSRVRGDAEEWDRKYRAFRRQFTRVEKGFGSAGGSEFLFGPAQNPGLLEASFLPFFQAVRDHFRDFRDEERFLPGAFHKRRIALTARAVEEYFAGTGLLTDHRLKQAVIFGSLIASYLVLTVMSFM